MKKCTKCKKEKDVLCFTNNTKLCDSCKERIRISNAIYREKNKEKVRERNRKWRAKNPEKNKANSRKWRAENKEKVRAGKRKWKAENPEKVREARRKWRAENPEKISAIQKRRVERLYDHYIAARLNIPVEELRKNPDLLEAKRTQIQIHRLLKTKNV